MRIGFGIILALFTSFYKEVNVMAKIKIKDLPKDTKISKAEMEKITGVEMVPQKRIHQCFSNNNSGFRNQKK